MKSSLWVIGILLFAASANAQHHSTPTLTSTSPWSGPYNPSNASRSGGGGDGYGSGYGSGSNGYGGGGHLRVPSHAMGQTSNDSPYVPTTLMDYNEAVALGKQQLAMGGNAAPAAPGPSLAEAARAYRAAKVRVSATARTGLVEGDTSSNTSNNSGISSESTGNSATSTSGPALADVAREFRASRNIVSPAHAFAVQDNSGRLHVCDSAGANCN